MRQARPERPHERGAEVRRRCDHPRDRNGSRAARARRRVRRKCHRRRLGPEIERHKKTIIAILALVEQKIALRDDRPIVPGLQCASRTADRDQPPVKRMHRVRLAALRRDIQHRIIRRECQPRLGAGEAPMRAVIPGHRRAAAVATESLSRNIALGGVAHALGRNPHLLHPELVAVGDGWRAAQREQLHRGDARLLEPDAGRNARPVVIAQYPVRPAAGRKGRFIRRSASRSHAPARSRSKA